AFTSVASPPRSGDSARTTDAPATAAHSAAPRTTARTLCTLPHRERAAFLGRLVEARGSRGARGRHQHGEALPGDRVDAELVLALVGAGRMRIVDRPGLRRGIDGERELHHHLRPGIDGGLVTPRDAPHPFDGVRVHGDTGD